MPKMQSRPLPESPPLPTAPELQPGHLIAPGLLLLGIGCVVVAINISDDVSVSDDLLMWTGCIATAGGLLRLFGGHQL